jgi:hypothetical protein
LVGAHGLAVSGSVGWFDLGSLVMDPFIYHHK